MKANKILLNIPYHNSFINSDIEILKPNTLLFNFHSNKKAFVPFFFIKQLLHLILNFNQYQSILSHFTGYHTLIPSLLSFLGFKKHYIVLHGTECNNYPEYDYGFLRKPLLFKASYLSLKGATMLLPVSISLVYHKNIYSKSIYHEQGLESFYKDLKTPKLVIPNGIDPHKFFVKPQKRNPKSFLSICGNLKTANGRVLKGIDLIILLAKHRPDYSFSLIGDFSGSEHEFPENIQLLGKMPHEQLVDIYNENAFYLQLSITEGFGLSLVEAMACGCVPIISNVCSMPELIKPFGYILETKDLNQLMTLVEKAIQDYETLEIAKMAQVKSEQFDIKIRANMLRSLLN